MLDSDHPASVEDDRRLPPDGKQVVAFLDDEATTVAVRAGLAPLGNSIDVRRGGLRQAIRFFRSLAPVRAAIIDISDAPDLASGELQPALDELARTCPPDVPVFLLGTNTDITFYRLVVHEMGATDYFPRPLTRDLVQRQLLPRLLGTAPEIQDARSGRVIAFCGARGGVGATTLAVNSILQLAGMSQNQSVGQLALLDLHLQDGSAAMMLGARPGTGLRVALEDPTRSDALFLERATIAIDQRLHLVAADEASDSAAPVTSEGVVHVFDVLRRRFNFIFVDVPMPVPPEMRMVLRLAWHVVVVLHPDLPGLRDAHALRQAATQAAGTDRVFTVLNRADMRGALKRDLVERGLGRAPDFVIPDLGGRMTEAVNLGKPALTHVPALRRHVLPLVREVVGLPAETPGRWLLSRLVSR